MWLPLDDSIQMEAVDDYGHDLEYCPRPDKMSNWVEWLSDSAFKEFARSYYWSAWRNNGINLSWVLCFGQYTDEVLIWNFGSKAYYRIFRYGKIALSQFQSDYGGWRFQIGHLKNGKFELQLTKHES